MKKNEIGVRIREARKKRGLGVNQLAKLAGVSGAAVSRWERGERKPRLEELMRVVAVLNIDYKGLFKGFEPDHIKQIMSKMNTDSRDVRLVLMANPSLTPVEVDIIMRIVETKEREMRPKKR